MERHSQYVYRLAYRMTGNKEDAEEVVQEAFLRAYQKLQQFAGSANFGTWVYRIAANYAIDRLRQRSRRSHMTSMADLDFAVFELTPERQVSGEQAIAIIRAAVARLPAKCRQAFLLHRVYEMRMEDIAARMGIGVCMARRYVARGLEYVRQCLDTQS